MEGEKKPVIVVDETRIDFVLDHFGSAVNLGALVGNLRRFAILIFPLVSDCVGLRVPLPRARNF